MKGRIVFRVLPDGRGWLLTRSEVGKGRLVLKSAADGLTKQETVNLGVEKAKAVHAAGWPAQLVIHDRGGQFQSERTYGADPRRRKG